MQEMKGKHEVVRVVMGIVLLALASGIWGCLWVPPFQSLSHLEVRKRENERDHD